MRVNAHKQNRKIYKMSEFRGVDYSSSPLEVKPYRATDMANLILKDGTLHKRNGFEQLFRLWSGNKDFAKAFICNGGLVVFTANNVAWYSLDKEIEKKGSLESTFTKDITAVHCGDKLYIYTGVDIYTFDGNEVKPFTVSEDASNEFSAKIVNDAYIPKTTVNIPRSEMRGVVGSSFKNAEVVEAEIAGQAYVSGEPINMLTRFRENVLSYSKPQATYEVEEGEETVQKEVFANYYKLDGKVVVGSPSDASYYDGHKPKVTIVYPSGDKWTYSFVHSTQDAYWESPDTGMKIGLLSACSGETVPRELDEWCLWFPTNYSPDWEDCDVRVMFSNPESVSNAGTIASCNVAIAFGVDGANDRIFLAGANYEENIVFYSDNDYGGRPDATYFPATNQISCGSANSPISSFMRVSDGVLSVFKDISDASDVSTYYIAGAKASLGAGEEGNEYYQDVFSVKAGGIQQKGVSARAVANLEGDSIFTAKDGVYGIQLSDNVASAERYAKERSRVINTKLTQFNLTKAKGIVHNGRYYLAVGGDEDEVYVADSRYKYNIKGDAEDGFNYEWFRWTNVPAIEWFEYNFDLYFISKDGWICKMTKGYADIYTAGSADNKLTIVGGYLYFHTDELAFALEKAVYAVDNKGNQWTLGIETNESGIPRVKKPDYAIYEDGESITLKIYLPIYSHWKSAIIDLENSMYRKNLWSLSTTVIPTEGGFVKVGYKTRYNEQMKERTNKQIEGAYVFSFDDIDFSVFNFDCGGFVNAFRQRVFERGFVYIQLAFASESIGDCIVTEMALEYSPTVKNLGVG